jgi:hypothetical protein
LDAARRDLPIIGWTTGGNQSDYAVGPGFAWTEPRKHFAFHIFIEGGQGIAPGLVFSVLEIFLIYAYRGYFRAIFTAHALPTLSEGRVPHETLIVQPQK